MSIYSSGPPARVRCVPRTGEAAPPPVEALDPGDVDQRAPDASDVSRCTLLLAAEQGLLSVVAAVQFRCIMRLEPSQRRASIRGQQVYLSLLAILLSHLLLMATPLHDIVLLGHRAPDEAMAAHAIYAAPGDCVGLTAAATHEGGDCAIRATTPPRSGFGSLLGSTPPGRLQPPALVGLLPAPPDRSIWPPPPSDPQALFQVFRL